MLHTYTIVLILEAQKNPSAFHRVKRTIGALSYQSAKRALVRSYISEGWFVRHISSVYGIPNV